MKHLNSITLVTKIFLSILLFCSIGKSDQTSKKAPAFSLKDETGRLRKLEEFKGNYLVLEWFNDGCPYVQKHYQSGNMQTLQKKWISQNVRWLTVLSSAPHKQGHLNATELKRVDATWKVQTSSGGAKTYTPTRTAALFDSNGIMGSSYGATATPFMVVIAPDQKIIYQGAMDDQPSSRLETVKGATNYVSLALEQHMNSLPVQHSLTKAYGCSIKYAD